MDPENAVAWNEVEEHQAMRAYRADMSFAVADEELP